MIKRNLKGQFIKGSHIKSEFKKGHSKPKNAYAFLTGKNNPNWKKGKPKCIDCRKELSTYKNKRCKKCFLKYNKGEKGSAWKGGKWQKFDGRWFIWKPNHPFVTKDGYVRHSRLTAEKCFNRYLMKKEVIHHINGNPSDDHPKNLYLFSSQSKHSKYESLKNKPKLISNLTPLNPATY